MDASAFAAQFLNGLAGASSLFLVAAGLSLIFGVTRVVNFAHGSLYMLGMYLAVWLSGKIGFWAAVPAAALVVAAFGLVVEVSVLRRLYRAPQLLQLLATFAVVLVVRDLALWLWGPEDMLGPRAPGLEGALPLGPLRFPEYDAFLIVLGPLVFVLLYLLFKNTRWGILVRAATQDREMAGALGVNQRLLFSGVFAAGALLAGFGGASAIPRDPASLGVDLEVVSDAFVVVVVGGLGSIPGALLASFVIGEVKAFCIAFGLAKLNLAVEFVVMALVLIARPSGLLGKPLRLAPVASGSLGGFILSRRELSAAMVALILLVSAPVFSADYTLILLTEILVFALFAASLQFIMGPGGMDSFGHAAYFGLGAYGAGLLLQRAGLPMELAALLAPLCALAGAALFGWFSVRLSGIYLAMLTLAFAQIAWSAAYQWDSLTGGSNGLIGVWPAAWLSSRSAYYYAALVLCAFGIALLWRAAGAPFGYALRAGRDSPLRADALGIAVRRTQWLAFCIAGFWAGVAGMLYAFSKGSISPESLDVPRSVDGLVMVLLGGIQSLAGAPLGAAVFTWLQDALSREVPYWRAAIGGVILVLTLLLPRGIAGLLRERRRT